MIIVPNAFIATHIHKKSGDEYEELVDFNLQIAGVWQPAVLYRNREAQLAGRLKADFDESFAEIPQDPQRFIFVKEEPKT